MQPGVDYGQIDHYPLESDDDEPLSNQNQAVNHHVDVAGLNRGEAPKSSALTTSRRRRFCTSCGSEATAAGT